MLARSNRTKGIVKRGTDPRIEPQPTDISKATDADVLFHNMNL